jgi:hypothetical protein
MTRNLRFFAKLNILWRKALRKTLAEWHEKKPQQPPVAQSIRHSRFLLVGFDHPAFFFGNL